MTKFFGPRQLHCHESEPNLFHLRDNDDLDYPVGKIVWNNMAQMWFIEMEPHFTSLFPRQIDPDWLAALGECLQVIVQRQKELNNLMEMR